MTDATTELLTERGKTHGDFRYHAETTQHLKACLVNSVNWPTLSYAQREALEMIVHKIGRILSGNPDFADHWDDIAGYAKLVPLSIQKNLEDEITERMNKLEAMSSLTHEQAVAGLEELAGACNLSAAALHGGLAEPTTRVNPIGVPNGKHT